jgi:uncharacterized membrane protein YkvA (DUF1232 family)
MTGAGDFTGYDDSVIGSLEVPDMSTNPNPASHKVNIFISLLNRMRLVFRLMRDSRVPIGLKIVPFLSIIYILFPLDLIPDLIPALGQVDDLGVVILAVETFIMLSPQDVVQQHMADIAAGNSTTPPQDTVVDGEWRRVDR